MSRICLFSCGAASAIATKLTLNKYPNALIFNTEIKEEHPDNRRFFDECQEWFGKEIKVWRNEKYNSSIYEVFEKERYIQGIAGAACTLRLKRSQYKEMFKPGDKMIIGFTVEEEHRLNRLVNGVGGPDGVEIIAPLIDAGLTKGDCLALISRAGIEIPEMYKLGYKNNNCIGCVKGGMGYWNKIRVDFPDTFQRMADLQDELGVAFFQGKKGEGRVSLNDLDSNRGRIEDEPDISCGIFCQLAEM